MAEEGAGRRDPRFPYVPKFTQIRSNEHLRHGLGATAVILGGGVSILAASAGFQTLAIVVTAILGLVLTASAVPAAFAKSRRLVASLRWWHGLWFMVFASGLVFRIRDIETIHEAPVDFWAAWRIGLMVLVTMVLLDRLTRGRTNWVAPLLQGLPVGVFLLGLVSLISTFWSVYPVWTFYKSVEYLIDVALLAAILTSLRSIEDIRSLFNFTWFCHGMLVLTVWSGVIFRPEAAVVPSLGPIGIQISGVLPSIAANGVGDLGATLLVVGATRLLLRKQHRGFYLLVCLIALPTLILAQSRTPATAAVLGLAAVFLLARRLGLLTLVGVVGGAVILLTSAETIVQQAFLRGQNPEQFESLSGRLFYWTAALRALQDSPLLGHGAWAGGRFAVLGPLGETVASSVHNAWLEILLGVGVIGLILFLVTFLRIWPNLLAAAQDRSLSPAMRELRLEAVGIFVVLCFRSIFTVEFIWHPPLAFLLILGYAELLRRSQIDGISPSRKGGLGKLASVVGRSRADTVGGRRRSWLH